MPSSTMRTVCVEDHVCTILAVDDEITIIDTLKMLFASQKGIKLLTATTKEEAKTVIRQTPNLELVLLDLRLGHDEPIQTLKEIVAVADGRVAVIAISGDHLLEDAASKNGAIDFWGKPLLELDIIGRSKFAIINQRKVNHYRDQNIKLVDELAAIRQNVKENPDKAIEELDVTTQELRREIQTLMMRAN